MPYFEIVWNEEPGGNVEHIAEHGLTPDDVEEVIFNPSDGTISRSSGLPIAPGFTPDGRYILVVYEQTDEITIYPVTAHAVEEWSWQENGDNACIVRLPIRNERAMRRFEGRLRMSCPISGDALGSVWR